MINSTILKKIDNYQQLINQYRPLDQQQVKNLKEYFRIGLTYSSNAIEGNTLTESETKVVLEDGVTIGGKPLRDHLDAIGHAKAFDYLWALAHTPDLSEQDIQELHRLCFQPKDGEQAGCYRTVDVLITGSAHNDELPRFEDIPSRMKAFVESLPAKRSRLHPVEYAAVLHQDFIQIHPFADGNGRVARLIMNHALLRAGFPPVIISPAFKHEYISALERGWTDKQAFIEYIAKQELQAQREYIKLLKLPEISRTGGVKP